MFVFSAGMKKPTILEEEKHKNLRLALPSDFSFLRRVVALPLGYSEVIAASMYYPVLFGFSESFIYPYAVLGIEEKNLFVNDEGEFIVDVIPRCAELYPFGVAKKGDDYLVVYDERAEASDGEPVFAEDGGFTPFFTQRKEELTNYALDIDKALEFAKTAYENGLLKHIEALKIDTKHGSVVLKNILIANAVEAIPKLSPERLYHFNVTGYLPILYATYFSVRNFKIFDLIA
jgi:hypothetical protein